MADRPESPRPLAGEDTGTTEHGQSTQLLTREEVAKLLRCSLRHVDALRSQGRLRDVRLGTRVLVPMSEIQRLIETSMGRAT
jgi:excisionase family DNA binding protein